VHQCTLKRVSPAPREPFLLFFKLGSDSELGAELAAGPWARDVKQWQVARAAGCSAAITAAAAGQQGVRTVQ
jgi:hypothetical protein